MYHGSYEGVSSVFQGCYMAFIRVLREWFIGVSIKLQGCYKRGNLLRSVPCVSVGHQHVNFFQKSFREKSFCMLVYIG